jgi:hypothetical protein
MPKVTFPYNSFPIAPSQSEPNGSTAHRPVAVATITATNGRSVRWVVIPDSGADSCVFPLSLAFLLQLDPLKMDKSMTSGVGSQANITYFDILTIDLGQGVSFTCKVGFTQGLDAVGFGLLGQDGFFSNFDVHFSHKQKLFDIEVV